MATQQTADGGPRSRRALGHPALRLDDRAAGDDALFLDACATACSIPTTSASSGLQNYTAFLTDPNFITALINTLVLVVSVLVISVCGGILVALLMDQPVFGQNVLRLMVIAPFFVMPTVSALVWKNLLMNPDFGPVRLDRAVARLLADRLVHQLADAVGRSSSCPGNGCRSRASSF